MKIFVILSLLWSTTGFSLPIWTDGEQNQWRLNGRTEYDVAEEDCEDYGGRIPTALEMERALAFGIADRYSNPYWDYTSQILNRQNGLNETVTENYLNHPDIFNGTQFGVTGAWVKSSSRDKVMATYDGSYNYMAGTSSNARGTLMRGLRLGFTVCLLGGGGTPPPPPPPPPSSDECARFSPLGSTACINHFPTCDWSSTSSKCYVKVGEICEYYSQHGSSACLDNFPRCDWSRDSRSCYTN